MIALGESSGEKEDASRESTPPSKNSLSSGGRTGDFDRVSVNNGQLTVSSGRSTRGLNVAGGGGGAVRVAAGGGGDGGGGGGAGSTPEHRRSTSPSMSMSPSSSNSMASSPALDVDSAASMEPPEEDNLSAHSMQPLKDADEEDDEEEERRVKKTKSTGEFAFLFLSSLVLCFFLSKCLSSLLFSLSLVSSRGAFLPFHVKQETCGELL